ncbi:hypothetical protein IHE45_10G015200 [Dioscorea alata]|uniref:Uncharacterized protein n=1 Tax=Dioscorea alata TaxID=55571 RepID=A0ACB7V945_DIOAL|nr:hypothetical protein IHE45_10G015200 [Dioscorea alata]
MVITKTMFLIRPMMFSSTASSPSELLGLFRCFENYTKFDKEYDDDDDDDNDILNGAVTPTFGVPVEIINTRMIKVELEKVIANENNKTTKAEESFPVRRRASLGELFMKSKLEESIDSLVTEKNIPAKPSKAKKRSFSKFMQVFHRKVHPENMSGMVENKVTKEVKQEIKGKPPIGKNFFKSEIYRKISFSCFKCGSSTSPPMLEENDSCPRISREHWIKTDAEYLVLEL